MQSWFPLLQETLAREGVFRWQLSGQSMEPTLPDGCEIEIVPASGEIPHGTVVVFAGDGALVAHRVVHRSGSYLILQGDGRRTSDRWLLPGQVLGSVVASYHHGRRIWPGRAERLSRWRWIGRAFALAGLRRGQRILRGFRKD